MIDVGRFVTKVLSANRLPPSKAAYWARWISAAMDKDAAEDRQRAGPKCAVKAHRGAYAEDGDLHEILRVLSTIGDTPDESDLAYLTHFSWFRMATRYYPQSITVTRNPLTKCFALDVTFIFCGQFDNAKMQVEAAGWIGAKEVSADGFRMPGIRSDVVRDKEWKRLDDAWLKDVIEHRDRCEP